MNRKFYSILFSALLATTFIHELRAKCVLIPAVGSSNPTGVTTTPAPSSGGTLCTSNSTSNATALSLFATANATIFVIANASANVFLAIDFNASLVAVFNGNLALAVVLNLTSQTGVLIPSGSGCGCTWNKNTTSLQNFVSGLANLSALLRVTGGIAFTVATASAAVLAAINGVLIFLFVNLAVQIQNDVRAGIVLLVDVSIQIVVLLRGVLNGLLVLVGSLVIVLVGDVAYLLNVLLGLGSVCSNSHNNGLRGLLNLNLTLDLEVILGSNNATGILIYLLAELSLVINVGAALGGLLNSAENLFCLLAQLGGNINVGVTGLFKVVACILLYISGRIQLEVLINVIILFVCEASQAGTAIDLNANIRALLVVVLQIGGTALAGLVVILKAILAGTFTVGGCNISAIIIKLIQGVLNTATGLLLVVVVNVLILLSVVVNVSLSIPSLLFVLLINLNSPLGCRYLQILGINLNVSISGIVGSILLVLLGGVLCLVKFLLGDYIGFLRCFPVINVIFTALDTACKQSDQPTLNLSVLLRAATGVLLLIFGLLQWLVGLVLGIAFTVIAQVQGIYSACGSTQFFLNINIFAVLGFSVSG